MCLRGISSPSTVSWGGRHGAATSVLPGESHDKSRGKEGSLQNAAPGVAGTRLRVLKMQFGSSPSQGKVPGAHQTVLHAPWIIQGPFLCLGSIRPSLGGIIREIFTAGQPGHCTRRGARLPGGAELPTRQKKKRKNALLKCLTGRLAAVFNPVWPPTF